jgi:hypothetical protein
VLISKGGSCFKQRTETARVPCLDLHKSKATTESCGTGGGADAACCLPVLDAGQEEVVEVVVVVIRVAFFLLLLPTWDISQ